MFSHAIDDFLDDVVVRVSTSNAVAVILNFNRAIPKTI